ncbi:oligopeptide transporter [Venturia nashicola]|nr:oligopeptide transporter [Venturia nashicola]
MATEVLDRQIAPGGHINPSAPLGSDMEKDATFFNTPVRNDSDPTESFHGDEKVHHTIEVGGEEEEGDSFIRDPFRPFDDLPSEKQWVMTIRAVFVGLCCGCLVNASNVYLGLKTGWTFSANLFGAIAGFAVLKFLSTTVAENFPIIGGSFGPRENNIVQTAAMASGGLSNVFISAFPALYQLGLLKTPKEDFWRIVSLTAVGGYFGFFFATPLRKFFIVYVARELRLIFPSASATAMTIRSMHDATRGEQVGKMKMKALSIAFGIAFTLRVVSQYCLGILWEWHFFLWFYIWGHYKNLAIHVENWGWFVQFTPAFIGAGMLTGLNVSISFFGGSVLAWGIIGPALVHNNAAFGKLSAPGDPKWGELVTFYSFTGKSSTKEAPSPRYWLLWPGVLAMIAISFTELLLQWKIIWFAFQAVGRGVGKGLVDMAKLAGKDLAWLRGKTAQPQTDLVEDPASEDEQVKMWMWLPGLVATIISICVVLGVQYDMPVGMSLLSVFLAFFFSFLAVQCTGVTDITPLTAASKASQIILGGATKGEHWQTDHAQRLNLLGGALANMGANQATDLTQDFRTGFLLRTPPIQQWLVQGVGTFVAIFLAPAIFRLFMTAYPCVILMEDKCAFSAPSVSAWRIVAIAATDPTLPIPTSAGIFAIIFAAFGCFMCVLRHYVWVGKLEWVRTYHPNMMCVSLAFVLPQTYYGTAMVIGSTAAYLWEKKNAKHYEVFCYAVAAGLIAGEGIGGVINAILQIAGVSGDYYGSGIACPGGAC